MTGGRVEVVANHVYDVGEQSVEFEARGLPPGIYFYRLRSGGRSRVGKMVRVR